MRMVKKIALPLSMAAAAALAPLSAAAQQSAESVATATPYRINPGDELEIHVWGEQALQKQVRVLPDGTVAFPLAGQMPAAGRLVSDLEAEVARRLVPQFKDEVPPVTVMVRSSGLQFSVIGKVRSPGTYTPGRYVNALEALSLAGGTTEFADIGRIVIIRKQGNQLVAYRVSLANALRGTPSAEDLASGLAQIQSGDTIVVP